VLLTSWVIGVIALGLPSAPSDGVSVVPAFADVRTALVAGDAATARALLAIQPSAPVGLRVRAAVAHCARERSERAQCSVPTDACAVIDAFTDATDVPAAVRDVHVALCAAVRARASAAPSAATVAAVGRAASGVFADDARVIDAVVDVAAVVDDATAARWLAPVLTLPLPVSDAERRAAAARALRVLGQRGPAAVRAPAWQRLHDELPDLVIDADAAHDPERGAPTRRVARAAVLEKLHENAAVIDLVKDLVAVDCEAALLVGKAERKLRHYQAARVALAKATADRCGEVQKKARYLEARVARVQSAVSAEKTLQAFVDAYGTDSLVDDVLLWLSEVRADKGDHAGSRAALTAIVADHAGGDMADEARFRLAFAHVDGTAPVAVDDAIAGLAAAEAALAAAPRPRVDLSDRARYWRLRLAVFPDPNALKSVDDEVAKAALAAFARERRGSFYGVVADALLRTLPSPPPLPPVTTLRASASTTVPLPPALAKDARFALAQQAVRAGFDDDAAVLLAGVANDVASGVASAAGVLDSQQQRDAAFAVAALFMQAGRKDLAHQAVRARGFALLPGSLDASPSTTAQVSLAWPRAFADVLDAAADEAKLPRPLLMGLAREESTFDKDVVSWAGAIGLCQLMPPTAAEEARALKLADTISTAEILDPRNNARLGAAHLGRRLRGMSHPFLAIAAYNAGPGMVLKWLPAQNTTRPVDAFVEDIPVDETRNYVKKVVGSWSTYAALDGFEPVLVAATVRGKR
jgi:soluble lytic murein transglycosylase